MGVWLLLWIVCYLVCFLVECAVFGVAVDLFGVLFAVTLVWCSQVLVVMFLFVLH